jgi:hypothetical protein
MLQGFAYSTLVYDTPESWDKLKESARLIGARHELITPQKLRKT